MIVQGYFWEIPEQVNSQVNMCWEFIVLYMSLCYCASLLVVSNECLIGGHSSSTLCDVQEMTEETKMFAPSLKLT